ncbi:MAG: MFS transporter [Pseudomonadota bacterium]
MTDKAPDSRLGRWLASNRMPTDRATWRKQGELFTMQMAHDLPAALTTTMAPTLFIKQFGMPLEWLGLFFLPTIVTALKWTWAPVVDNHGSERFGYRKSWLAPLTLLVAFSFFVIAGIEPSLDTLAVLIGCLVVKQLFFSTQEIAADAYVVENIPAQYRGLGASVIWLGKEFGQIIGFAGLLFVAENYGWQPAFTLAAILFVVFNLPVLLGKEAAREQRGSGPLARPLVFFKHRVNWRIASIILYTAFAVQLPVAVMGPFLNAKGFSLSAIGVIIGIASSLGAVFSLSLSSVVLSRLGPKRMAKLLLIIAPLAAPAFLWLAATDSPGLTVVIVVVLWATICTAPIRMVLYAARIGWTSDHQVGTDITIQQSTWFLGYALCGLIGGLLAAQVGWFWFFAANVLLQLLALIYFIAFHDRVEADVQALRASA